jgi:hypothetical protein
MAVKSYQAELSGLEERTKELREKIDDVERELDGQRGGRVRENKKQQGRPLPFTKSDARELEATVAKLDVSGKRTLEAARLVYQAAGKPLSACLVYEVLVKKGFRVNATKRPKDCFTSCIRKSKEFERVSPGVFRLRIATVSKV